jgi:molybdopterin-guanine dinucleotide biosynthesis protein A
MTAAVVLAGGRSRRFGLDKLAVGLADGRSVLAHAVAAAASVADELVVVVRPSAPRPVDVPERTRIVHDPEPDAGPLIGLAAGLDAVSDGIVVVVGGDMPALESPVLRLLIAAVEADPGVEGARLEVDGWPRASVLPCVLRREAGQRACREAVATGDRRLRGCLERLAMTVVPVGEWRALDPTGRTLLDVDRPADLAALERLEHG